MKTNLNLKATMGVCLAVALISVAVFTGTGQQYRGSAPVLDTAPRVISRVNTPDRPETVQVPHWMEDINDELLVQGENISVSVRNPMQWHVGETYRVDKTSDATITTQCTVTQIVVSSIRCTVNRAAAISDFADAITLTIIPQDPVEPANPGFPDTVEVPHWLETIFDDQLTQGEAVLISVRRPAGYHAGEMYRITKASNNAVSTTCTVNAVVGGSINCSVNGGNALISDLTDAITVSFMSPAPGQRMVPISEILKQPLPRIPRR
ncbi:hypothetical protein KBD59_02720 [Candidatus Gracilibacteria bacterium]|nr:hypothetical protein [Candidatus Gracilibacteria bacterium]